MYGVRGSQPRPDLVSTTELGRVENGCHARSNTYDNPAANGTTVPVPPMYETVKAARSTSGPAVLNPVYGPTSATPTSPHPPPCKAAPNPVYSESGNGVNHSQQFVDVSGLNPVYAAIGKPASPPHVALSDPPPRYAYAYSSVKGTAQTNQPPSLKRADSAGYPPPVPMYEELQAAKRSDSMGDTSQKVGGAMTKNESYGVLGMPQQPPESATANGPTSGESAMASGQQ